MDTRDRDELYELFQRALALPPAERAAFVARWTEENPALGRELAELLRQDTRGGPLGPGAERLSLVAELAQELARDGAAAGPDPSSTRILERLAQRTPETRYSILGELARGGMGAILEVRDEDLGRRLAMKIALAQAHKTGGATPNLDARSLSRFLEEARVTGQLDHPGIVPVHELGVDGEGRLYFTMRLVEGRDLGEILALERAGGEGWTETRVLGVLLKACEAMSYAHSKGVVHRDLKPANVMVGRFGEVYVMDWGLADAGRGAPAAPAGGDTNAVAAPAAPNHPATRAGAILGTPGFMAPEQAAGRIGEVDERSDVYALGAMLYQLLTGRVPHDEQGESVPFARLQRSRSGPPTPIGALAPSAPAELVAISEKAMAADPGARYRDMGALGEDLRAFLEGRVVRAHATGAWAELRKWVRRNRALAASIAAGFVATLGGLVVALLQAQRAERNAMLAQENAALAEARSVEARTQAANAEREAQTTEKVADFMVGLFEASQPEVARGVVPTAEELLDSGVSSIEADLASTPLVRARLQEAMGRAYYALGLLEKAGPLLAAARKTHGEELGENDPRTLRSEVELAGFHDSEGRYALAESELRRVLELRRALLGERALDTLVVEKQLASVLGDLERTAEARALLTRVIEALGEVELDGRARSLAIDAQTALGVLAKRGGDLEQAERCYAKASELARDVWVADHPDALKMRNNLASLHEAEGRRDEAEAQYVETLRDQRRVCGVTHPDTLITLNNLAILYRRQNRMAEAEALYEEALATSREARGGDNPLTLSILENLAQLRSHQGRHAEAEELLEEVLDGRRALLGPDHAETLKAVLYLAENYLDQERVADAGPLYEQSFAGMRARLGERDPRTLQCANEYGYFLDSQGDHERAAELYETAYEGRRAVLGETDPATLNSLENLAQDLESLGKLEEALALATDCVAKSAPGPDREYREKLRLHLERALAARSEGAGK